MIELISSPFFLFSAGLLFLILIVLVVYFWFTLIDRDDKLNRMDTEQQKMLRSFNELDEQAKLIIKTDLELNKAQEELDKRLNGLHALQRTSRQIGQALNEEEVFEKLKISLFEDLGFSKTLLVINDIDHSPKPRTYIGFEERTIKEILKNILKDPLLQTAFNDGHTLSSINATHKIKEKITQLFETEHYVLAPIVTQTGTLGFIFVGNRFDSAAVTAGDEELITILAGQIGQAIENAQLFDKVFRSSQELEVKVKDRTKQLANALSQVEEINKKKTEFLSAVSHELRTPLTSIKGYAAILIAGKFGDIPVAVKERLAKINTHSDNLVNLINNLLDITRIESGRVEMHFAPQKTKTLLDSIADLLNPQVSAKEIKLVVDVPTEVPEIYIDISQAERIFINLLSNAVKFTPKAGTISLLVSPVIKEGFATFQVIDTGIGMSKDDLEKLFTEFFRVENEINQTVKGTGLGLVLAKDIVYAHGGTISVSSKVNAGTAFSFTLPTTKEALDQRKKPTPIA
jgi:signal transduction histidine kinase